jgi:hypothetical protein
MVISNIGDLLRLPKSQRGVGRSGGQKSGNFIMGTPWPLDAKSRLTENGMVLKPTPSNPHLCTYLQHGPGPRLPLSHDGAPDTNRLGHRGWSAMANITIAAALHPAHHWLRAQGSWQVLQSGVVAGGESGWQRHFLLAGTLRGRRHVQPVPLRPIGRNLPRLPHRGADAAWYAVQAVRR